MEGTIVLYPALSMGHLVSMVEFAKLILRYHHQFSVAILITTGLSDSPATTSYISHFSQTNPSITFYDLPSLPIPFSPEISQNRSSEATLLELIRLNNPNVLHVLQTISQTSPVRALVIDFFCTPALQIASDLDISTYYFITMGAAGLACLLYLPTMHNQCSRSFKDLQNNYLHLPGLPPIRASHMPEPVLDRDDQAYHDFLHISTMLPKSKGIIVNTFESLESTVIKAIADGICLPGTPIPALYSIGPLIANPDDRSGKGGNSDGVSECLSWLDAQPSRSVVFLCFGSGGVFTLAQVKDIATGLEKSGHRFLWVLRNPPADDNMKSLLLEFKDQDLEVLLPEGFLDRTKDRGLVVKSWAPQVEVLSRESVGGFVTHCGWNSVLEAVCAGVPMVAWPLYAEQHLNKAVLVEDMKLAMPIEQAEDGFVSSAEVEKRVKALMDSEEGRALRERSWDMKEKALAVWNEGGSSLTAFAKLAESWK